MSLKIGGGLGASISAKLEEPRPKPAVARAGLQAKLGHAEVSSFTPGLPPYLGLEPQRVLSAAKELGTGLWSLASPAIDWARQKATEALESEAVRDKLDALDPQKEIEQLGPGDSYKVGFEVNGSIEAAKGGVKTENEVKCRVKTNADGSPVLGPDGQPKLEYVVTTGGGLNGGAGSGSKSGTLGIDGRTEFVVDTPEEAKRALALGTRIRGGNPTPGQVDPPHFTPEEAEFIKQHATAIEVSGTVALSVAKQLGIKVDESVNGLQGAGLTGSGSLTLRLELSPDGGFTSATVKQQVQADVDVNPGDQGRKGTANVSIEDKFTFPPPGIGKADLLENPGGIADKLKQSTRETTLNVTVSENHGARGNQVELKISGQPDQVLNPALIERARNGDLQGALRESGKNVQAEVNVTTHERHGINGGLNIEVFDAKVQSERTDSEVVVSKKGTANDVADALVDAAQTSQAPLMRAEVRGRMMVAGLNDA